MLYLLWGIVIFLFSIAYMISKKDLLAPSVLTCIMFIICIMFAMINIKAWNIHYQFKTFLIMLAGIISFIIPSIFFRDKKNNENNDDETPLKPLVSDRKILIFCLLTDIIITIFYIIDVYKISLLGGNTMGIAGMSYYYRIYTAMNSDAETISTLMNQFLKFGRALGFVSIFIYAYNSQVDKNKKRDRILIPFILLTALQNLIGGGRGYILWLIGTGFSTYYIVNMKKYNWKKAFGFKYIKYGIIILSASLIGFYLLKYLIRIGNKVDSAIDYISYYAGGSIQNFNLYLQDPPEGTKKIWGQESFSGIYSTLQQFKLYDTNDVYLTNSNLEFRASGGVSLGNVYGAIRRYYNDFGVLGVIILQFICSLFYNSFYYNIKNASNEKSKWNILFYSYLLYHIYEMPIDDIFFKSYLSFNMITTFLILFVVYYLMTNVQINKSKIIFRTKDII